ncbi:MULTISPECIES: hypothetical protein, partial [unclassified Pseudomonas]|uniref:hypothetical protein n=1 Tax=unclassified Pseudomonas TaxID=196821 RepID=UPI002449FD76
ACWAITPRATARAREDLFMLMLRMLSFCLGMGPVRRSGPALWGYRGAQREPACGLALNLGDFCKRQKELFFTFMKLKRINSEAASLHKLIPEKYLSAVFQIE